MNAATKNVETWKGFLTNPKVKMPLQSESMGLIPWAFYPFALKLAKVDFG